jgi:hypothetical protein
MEIVSMHFFQTPAKQRRQYLQILLLQQIKYRQEKKTITEQ